MSLLDKNRPFEQNPVAKKKGGGGIANGKSLEAKDIDFCKDNCITDILKLIPAGRLGIINTALKLKEAELLRQIEMTKEFAKKTEKSIRALLDTQNIVEGTLQNIEDQIIEILSTGTSVKVRACEEMTAMIDDLRGLNKLQNIKLRLSIRKKNVKATVTTNYLRKINSGLSMLQRMRCYRSQIDAILANPTDPASILPGVVDVTHNPPGKIDTRNLQQFSTVEGTAGFYGIPTTNFPNPLPKS